MGATPGFTPCPPHGGSDDRPDETTDEGPSREYPLPHSRRRRGDRSSGVAVHRLVPRPLSYDCSGGIDCYRLTARTPGTRSALLMSVFLAGIIGAALIVVGRAAAGAARSSGLDLGQFGVAFTVFAAWTALLDRSSTRRRRRSAPGLILGLLATARRCAGGRRRHARWSPRSRPPLVGAPKPAAAAQPPYGGQPGQGYGYPGAQQQPYGAPARPAGPAAAGGQPGQPGQAAARRRPPRPSRRRRAPRPGGDFTPFWFAVPVARPLYAEDGSPTPIAELAPGTWYLAVEQRGPAPGRPDAGRPSRRPAGHHGHPARLTPHARHAARPLALPGGGPLPYSPASRCYS